MSEKVRVNERQRMQYLEVLGVDSFAPRWILPGARLSVQVPLPAIVPGAGTTAMTSPEPLPAPLPEGSPAPKLVDRLLAEVEATPKSAVPVRSVDVSAPPDRDVAKFSLSFWRVHPQVMFVDSRQPKALPTEALLQSIAVAMGLTGAISRPEVQTWPLPGVQDKTWEAARETIQAFLESRLLGQPVRFLVLMGPAAVRAVLPADAPSDISPGRIALDAFACDALLTPSLAQLLLEPAQKAQLWRLLAPLRLELA